MHGGVARPHLADQVFDDAAVFVIEHIVAPAADKATGQAHFLQQQRRLPGHVVVGGSQFQMVPFPWLQAAAARQKSAPQKGDAAAILFHHRPVQVQGGAAVLIAKGLEDPGDLLWFFQQQRVPLLPCRRKGDACAFA